MNLQSQITPSYRNEDAYRDHQTAFAPVAGYDRYEALRMEDAMLDAMRTQPAPPTPPKQIRTKARALTVIRDNGAITTSEVARKMGVKPASIRRVLNDLLRMGFVNRTRPNEITPWVWTLEGKAASNMDGGHD